MIIIKNTLLGGALVVALSAIPARAADFHALAGLRGTTPTALEDEALAATEGGLLCTVSLGLITVSADSGAAGGSCVIGVATNSAGALAIFVFATTFPAFSANFLQLVP
ncbi:MAG: hypothetical protein ACREYF_27040 [Gammaproteobacteria bacterium]